MIIAHHHVNSGYGFWATNDIRGSGSVEIREEKFESLGPIHHGRKRVQPSRDELREFHRKHEQFLKHDLIWFDESMRNSLGDAVERLATARRYTIWGFAALRNHMHVLTRVHKDDHLTQWGAFADATREAIRKYSKVPNDHPVWSLRPYTVFKDTPQLVATCAKYVFNNPEKEGLPRQDWSFVKPYAGR